MSIGRGAKRHRSPLDVWLRRSSTLDPVATVISIASRSQSHIVKCSECRRIEGINSSLHKLSVWDRQPASEHPKCNINARTESFVLATLNAFNVHSLAIQTEGIHMDMTSKCF